jgi:hypothetical protein
VFSQPGERGPQDASSAGCQRPLPGQEARVEPEPELLHLGFCPQAPDLQWTGGHFLKDEEEIVL